MKRKVLLLVTLALFVCASVYAADTKELEKKLEDRYKKGQKVNVVPGKIIVAPYEVEGIRPTDSDFSVHYDHFYKGVEMSKRYQKRDELDERTTSEVDAKARFISEMTPGETLELLRVEEDRVGIEATQQAGNCALVKCFCGRDGIGCFALDQRVGVDETLDFGFDVVSADRA